MSEVRFNRFVLVWEGANYCAASEYTPDEYHQTFDEQERTQLLAGYEVDQCVDLEAYYHRKSKEEGVPIL